MYGDINIDIAVYNSRQAWEDVFENCLYDNNELQGISLNNEAIGLILEMMRLEAISQAETFFSSDYGSYLYVSIHDEDNDMIDVDVQYFGSESYFNTISSNKKRYSDTEDIKNDIEGKLYDMQEDIVLRTVGLLANQPLTEKWGWDDKTLNYYKRSSELIGRYV